jgi:hypothetical protein
MAVWEVRAVLSFGDRNWENVYHIDAGAADDVAGAVLDELANFYLNNTFETYVLQRIVRRVLGTADAFIEISIESPGLGAVGSSVPAPLFNTVAMLFDSGIGRPGLKYLRGMLLQTDIVDVNGTLRSGIITGLNSAFDLVLNAASDAAQTFVFGASNKAVVSTSFRGAVQERQRHRRRRRAP